MFTRGPERARIRGGHLRCALRPSKRRIAGGCGSQPGNAGNVPLGAAAVSGQQIRAIPMRSLARARAPCGRSIAIVPGVRRRH